MGNSKAFEADLLEGVTVADEDWTIEGLSPGLSRSEVLQRKGRPLGDGCFGQWVEALPVGSVVEWERYPVWHYGTWAVVFRGDVVVQVLGQRRELDGVTFQDDGFSPPDDWSRFESNSRFSFASPQFPYRLLPLPVQSLDGAQSSDRVLRDRLRETLAKLDGSRAIRFDLEADATPQDLALCEDWVTGDPEELRWTPLALRRALWECLHYGEHFWQVDAPSARRRRGHIIATNSWGAEPVHVRLRLLVDAEIRLAQRRGSPPPAKIAMDELDLEECAAAYQRLFLAGESPAAGFWRSLRRDHSAVRLLEGNQPTPSLRWAAAMAQLVDERRTSNPFLFPGPPEGEYELGVALAGHPYGKPGWSWKGPALPEVALDWKDPVHRFHALWTPEGGKLKPFDTDRLSPILDALQRLESFGPAESAAWSECWASSLPGEEQERELLREIEFSAHFDRPIHHLANSLRRITAAARAWLPDEPSSDQRMLSRGLAQVLRSGLQVLGVL